MRQYYKPMLARLAPAPFTSKDWIFEIKWDGIRAVSYVNEDLSMKSRNNNELFYNFPEFEELKMLARNVVLDGEIVVLRGGKPDFQKLLERSRTASSRDVEYAARKFPALYVVFDMLEKDAKSLVDLPLMERKRLLKESVKEGKHVVLSAFVEKEGESYYEAALKMGLEGIMAKKKDSKYEIGVRSGKWLKIKKLQSCDCVIFGYTEGEGSRKPTFGALILGLYDQDKPVYVGKVGTGFSQSDLRLLMKTFKELETPEKTLGDVDVAEKVTWLKPKLVCEITYQAVTRDGRLRMPRFCGLRIDKDPTECTMDQMGRTSLQEYFSKRDFNATPEPMGSVKVTVGRVFVVQEHHARRLHYDLRLEKEGVLKSWAMPKGIPTRPGEKRLAVETEDHPLEYSQFEGTIPEGHYGAGTVKIWDKGEYETKLWSEDKIEFFAVGERLNGRYVLVRLKKADSKDWLLLKARD